MWKTRAGCVEKWSKSSLFVWIFRVEFSGLDKLSDFVDNGCTKSMRHRSVKLNRNSETEVPSGYPDISTEEKEKCERSIEKLSGTAFWKKGCPGLGKCCLFWEKGRNYERKNTGDLR